MIIIEYPHIASPPIATFARKDGQYTRPIISHMTDFRLEDMGIPKENRLANIIGKLPDIKPANQINKYIVATFGTTKIVDNDYAEQLIATNKYLVLPDTPNSPLWQATKRPWWEFMECMDEYDGVIKAALVTRSNSFTADNVDEILDRYPENKGRIEVLSPDTLNKMKHGAIRESYVKKLSRLIISASS